MALAETAAASCARVGIGGPVGSGKTALIEGLLPRFAARGTSLAIVTNDLVTKEDAERLQGFKADWTKPAEMAGRATLRTPTRCRTSDASHAVSDRERRK